MAPIRLVLATMPPLLAAIVRETLAAQHDIEILAEVADPEELLVTLRRTEASVAVVGVASNDAPAIIHELLVEQPRLRIVTLTSDGRTAVVHSLQPRESPIADISPETLLDAIRATRVSRDLHPRLHPFSAD